MKQIGKVLTATKIYFDATYFNSQAGSPFAGDMDDIPDGATYVKTENNLTDEEKNKIQQVIIFTYTL